jgi:hypothetical protein
MADKPLPHAYKKVLALYEEIKLRDADEMRRYRMHMAREFRFNKKDIQKMMDEIRDGLV